MKKGYWTTMSPLVVGNHVITGVSGDFDNLAGYLGRSIRRQGKRNGSGIRLRLLGRPIPQRWHDLDDRDIRS